MSLRTSRQAGFEVEGAETGGRASAGLHCCTDASYLRKLMWAPHLVTPWKLPHLTEAVGFLGVATHSVNPTPSAGGRGLPPSWDILPFPARKILRLPGLRTMGWLHRADEANLGTALVSRKK